MSSVLVRWKYVRDEENIETGFSVRRRVKDNAIQDDDGGYEEIGQTEYSEFSFVDKERADAMKYQYQVVACTPAGDMPVKHLRVTPRAGHPVDQAVTPDPPRSYGQSFGMTGQTPMHDQPLRGGPNTPDPEGPSRPQTTRP